MTFDDKEKLIKIRYLTLYMIHFEKDFIYDFTLKTV